MLDVMPGRGLVLHEWRKHGTCSGLDPDAYFDAVRNALGKVVIPGQFRTVTRPITTSAPEVENAFRVANPGLAADMIAVNCEDGRVSEVRICMDRSLGFTSCPAVDRRACRAGKITMPPMRGG
jgi:ribonuclease T2